MRHIFPLLLCLPIVLFSVAARAVVYEVTVVGGTDNTEVIGGDACGTGLTGPNACNGQTIVVEWDVFADAAPADQDPSATKGLYAAGSSPYFLAADVRINGQAFSTLAVPTLSRNQSIEIWDDLNVSGVADRIQLALTGNDTPGERYVASNLLLPETFSGDGLDVLASPFDGPPVFGGASTFHLENAAGRVIGQYVVASVTIGVPEPQQAAQLAAALATSALVSIRRSALAATR